MKFEQFDQLTAGNSPRYFGNEGLKNFLRRRRHVLPSVSLTYDVKSRDATFYKYKTKQYDGKLSLGLILLTIHMFLLMNVCILFTFVKIIKSEKLRNGLEFKGHVRHGQDGSLHGGECRRCI